VSHDVDISEVSDPRDITLDAPTEHPAPVLSILKGNPTDEELAALVTVLAGSSGGAAEQGPQELNRWGHPVDKLRYAIFSWQNVTLVERTHLRK
jgi:acyl-CoA carboxylase epsilon subunit